MRRNLAVERLISRRYTVEDQKELESRQISIESHAFWPAKEKLQNKGRFWPTGGKPTFASKRHYTRRIETESLNQLLWVLSISKRLRTWEIIPLSDRFCWVIAPSAHKSGFPHLMLYAKASHSFMHCLRFENQWFKSCMHSQIDCSSRIMVERVSKGGCVVNRHHLVQA